MDAAMAASSTPFSNTVFSSSKSVFRDTFSEGLTMTLQSGFTIFFRSFPASSGMRESRMTSLNAATLGCLTCCLTSHCVRFSTCTFPLWGVNRARIRAKKPFSLVKRRLSGAFIHVTFFHLPFKGFLGMLAMNARDKAWLAELSHEHPTPFWVLFPRVSQTHYFELADAFSRVAKKVMICYSVKTNPHPRILDALSKMESGFECVSLRELENVKSFTGPKILNSCSSSDEEITEALSQNALIILDSLSQAEQVARFAEKKPLSVGLRIRLDHHRFGFSPNELRKTIEHVSQLGLRVTVLHSHPGTNTTLKSYRQFMITFSAIVKEYPFLEGVDIGGGFPGSVSLHMRHEKLSDYANVVREQLGDFLSARALYVESGRFLSEDTMLLVTRVMHVKSVEGQAFALLDAGINLLPRLTMNPYRFHALEETGARKASIRLAGPLMFGSDELGQVSAALSVGNALVVENTGSYCTEMSWKLSRDFPKIIVIE
ncbi:MAG: hypothetical protein FJY86_03175 [Candidatus Diapherotrites archaeon]|uniref:Orn/DAP/Arg decarboxylase 2 N-terminal domain-containing protein n=1 Tax=Candidatus Iainarchaeum sp. TaxID=3101447 RepID=A0A8T4C6Z7_9ARCH|nr:hypothetical protein [Candidatus Diapherotrites archaeon]